MIAHWLPRVLIWSVLGSWLVWKAYRAVRDIRRARAKARIETMRRQGPT